MELPEMKIIARVHSDFASKFGVPRQSGLVEELESTLVFEPEMCIRDRGVRGRRLRAGWP